MALHSVIILGVFKGASRIPPPGGRLDVIEVRNFMHSDHGRVACWYDDAPLPAGTEAIIFLGRESELEAFRIGTISDPTLRLAKWKGEC